ncbi:uncharacterized protein PG986_008353 [Apiospora aurea]|uniref:Uncharacterized protein n=1 Tax=Apiospora aurea TaxID=335848 RepID=A0ABR1QF80_9PEZI
MCARIERASDSTHPGDSKAKGTETLFEKHQESSAAEQNQTSWVGEIKNPADTSSISSAPAKSYTGGHATGIPREIMASAPQPLKQARGIGTLLLSPNAALTGQWTGKRTEVRCLSVAAPEPLYRPRDHISNSPRAMGIPVTGSASGL